MSLTRRRLLELTLGAGQLALLGRMGGTRPAHAQATVDRPTRMLAIWIDGGLHWETFFTPLSRMGVQKYIPAPSGGVIPVGYLPEQVQNFDRSPADLDAPGPSRPLRGPSRAVNTSRCGLRSLNRASATTWSAAVIGLSTLTVTGTALPLSTSWATSSVTRPSRTGAPAGKVRA